MPGNGSIFSTSFGSFLFRKEPICGKSLGNSCLTREFSVRRLFHQVRRAGNKWIKKCGRQLVARSRRIAAAPLWNSRRPLSGAPLARCGASWRLDETLPSDTPVSRRSMIHRAFRVAGCRTHREYRTGWRRWQRAERQGYGARAIEALPLSTRADSPPRRRLGNQRQRGYASQGAVCSGQTPGAEGCQSDAVGKAVPCPCQILRLTSYWSRRAIASAPASLRLLPAAHRGR